MVRVLIKMKPSGTSTFKPPFSVATWRIHSRSRVSTTLGVYTHVVPEVFSGVTTAVNDASEKLLAGTYAPKMSEAQVRDQLRQLDPLLSEDVGIKVRYA